MITRPTTAQILQDCACELREAIVPHVTDPTARVRLEMLEQLLASCAVRASHEIEWMECECQAMEAYVADLIAAYPDEAVVVAKLDAYRSGRSDALGLDARVAVYDLAGRAFAAALEVAFVRGHPELSRRAGALVAERRNRETETRPGFYLPGRA